MHLVNDRVFVRQYKKLSRVLREQVGQGLQLLGKVELDPFLKTHKAHDPYEGDRSINITGDYRLIYKRIGVNMFYMRAVGTHHQLFGT